ncbi:AGAP002084-PB-like protein [Anopheles sinensis]|uniref:AGAP002084-PB-like protein n=1 Tax=Anopheles sinensis TaxID=74873 RepID=A0A084WSI9_ANOSI|nr:AGAP002084-PB-like protein [Anopheles sinensis]
MSSGDRLGGGSGESWVHWNNTAAATLRTTVGKGGSNSLTPSRQRLRGEHVGARASDGFGRQNIESVRQQQYANITKSVAEVEQARAANQSDGSQTTESTDTGGDGSETKVNGSIPNGSSTTGGQHRLSNGGDASYIVNGGNTVISRAESLILSPEMIDDTRSKSTEPHEEDGTSVGEEGTDGEDGAGTDGGSEGGGEHEAAGFKLANCLDYVKSGMEAIIEDEVTSRFLAEELKNWNLLTRTNRHYEFISWRLTVIWMIGFLIRYFILMPMRVLICFIGVSLSVAECCRKCSYGVHPQTKANVL